ncbi:MAG: methyltransferase domain-containing protein [Sphingobacteriales bacterium]|nr:methyltransferase domain-containing protein [Sphingobacteriales bacterium]
MNHNRIYEYRFADVDMQKKNVVWKEIAHFLYDTHLNKPQKTLDPAGGLCEFINHVPSAERWTIDLSDEVKKFAAPDIKTIIGNNLEVELPENYFDGVFISNFLEHLNSQFEVAEFLERMFKTLKSKGRIVIMGPNFRYTYKDYFNFADHTVILTELGVAEHLYGAGFNIVKNYPQFLPLSFRSKGFLPVNSFIIKTYLNMPFAWKFLGEQFLLVAEKP